MLAVLLIVVGVDEPERPPQAGDGDGRKRLRWTDARRLPAAYWGVVALAAVLTLARFSEAFLVLRAQAPASARPARRG